MSLILVVDDMNIFREPIAAALRHRGYSTQCAANGVEALQQVHANRPDLILLDVAMPEMDGITFLSKIKAEPGPLSKIPVILLTAVAERDYILQAAKLGVRDYLLKSRFSLDELVTRVDRYLGDKAAPAGKSASKPAGKTSGGTSGGSGNSGGGGGGSGGTKSALSLDRFNNLPVSDDSFAAGAAITTPETVAEAMAATKQLQPLVTRSVVQERLDAGVELRAVSPTVAAILELTNRKEASLDTLAKAIMRDHAVSIKILKLANSAIYTRGEPVDSVLKAVTRIGVTQVRQTVLNISVMDRFGTAVGNRLNVEEFWEHSLGCGLIASQLVHARGGDDDSANIAFTLGLLHDVGRMIFSEAMGEQYANVLDVADRLQVPLEIIETRLLLMNHAEVMERVLHAWNFPRDLAGPIAMHHLSIGNIRHIAPQMLELAGTLALADRLAHAMLLGSSGHATIYPTHEFCEVLRIPRRVIEAVEKDIPHEAQDIKLSLLARSGSDDWPTLEEQIQKHFGRPMLPLFIGTCPEVDGHAMLCRKIAQASGAAASETPDLAVVHVTDPQSRVELGLKLRDVEAQLHLARPLPVLVISQAGDLGLDAKTLNNRRHALLPSTVTLQRWLAAVNGLIDPQAASAAA